MSYNPFASTEAIPTRIASFGQKTGQAAALSGEIDKQNREANRPMLGLPSSLGFNPQTEQWSLGGKVFEKMPIAGIEQIANAAMQYDTSPEATIQELPAGFRRIQTDRLLSDIGAARANPEADFSALLPNALEAGGAIVSGIGGLIKNENMQNPFANAAADAMPNQSYAEQASYDESPWSSAAGLGTNLAQGFGQLVPSILTGILVGPLAGAAAGGIAATGTQMLSAAGMQGDSGYGQLLDALKKQSPSELAATSEVYAELTRKGMTHEQATAEMLTDARQRSAGVGALEGGIESLLGLKLFGTLSKALRTAAPTIFKPFGVATETGIAKRALKGAAIGGVAEGGGAIAGDWVVNNLSMGAGGLPGTFDAADAKASFDSEAPLGILLGGLGGVARGNRTADQAKLDLLNSDFKAATDNLNNGKLPYQAPATPPPVPPRPRTPPPPGNAPTGNQNLAGPMPDNGTQPMFDPQTGAPITEGPQSTLPFGTPAPAIPVGPRAPAPVDYATGQGPLPEPGIQQDLFNARTGTPENVGPAQAELALPPTNNPPAPLSYSDTARQQPLPLTTTSSAAQLELALTPPVESVRVADYFNNTVLPIIRQKEKDAGLGTENTEVTEPAETLSEGQAISSVRAAQKQGLLGKVQANTMVAQIKQRAKQDLKNPLPRREVAPVAAVTPEAPSPATPPAGGVTPETPVVTTAVAAATPALKQEQKQKQEQKPAPQQKQKPAPQQKQTGKSNRLKAIGRAVQNVQGKDESVANLEAGVGGTLTAADYRKTAREIEQEQKRLVKQAEETERAEKLKKIREAKQATTPLVDKITELVKSGEVDLLDLKQHLRGLRVMELSTDALDEAKTIRSVVDTVEDAVESAAKTISIFNKAVTAVKRPPIKAPPKKGKEVGGEERLGKPLGKSPPLKKLKPSDSTTGNSKKQTNPEITPKEAKSPGSQRAAGKDGSSLADSLRARVQQLQARMGKFAPLIIVVQSMDDIPIGLQLGASRDTRGIYDRGTNRVFIVADNVSEDRVERVMRHEVIGHWGLDQVLTAAQWESIKDEIREIRFDPRFESFFDRLKRDYVGLDEDGLFQEFIARAAEMQPNSNLIQRIVKMLQGAFAKLSLSASYEAVLEDMPSAVREALVRSERYTREGGEKADAKFRTGNDQMFDASATWESAREAMATGTKGSIGEAAKTLGLKMWTMRNLQEYYGGGKTIWGRAFKELADIYFKTTTDVQRRLEALAPLTARYTDLITGSRSAIRELMLMTQEYNDINPALSFEENSWLSRSTPEQEAKSRADYDKVRGAYDALASDRVRKVFDQLGAANRQIAVELIESRLKNYAYLQGIPLEQGGITADMSNEITDRYQKELEGLLKGRLNFSLQRSGDWLISVPGTEAVHSNHATRAEANAEALRLKDVSPYAKTKIEKLDNGTFDLRVTEPALYTFDSEADAIKAMPEIERDLKADLKEFYPTQAEADAAFEEIWNTGDLLDPADPTSPPIPRVTPMRRMDAYDQNVENVFSPELMKKLNAMKGKGLAESAYKQLVADYMTMTERSAFSKSQVGRKKIKGATAEKMMEAYIERYVSAARALASSKFAVRRSELMADLVNRKNQAAYKLSTGKSPERALNQFQKSEDAANSQLNDTILNKSMASARLVTTFVNLGLSASFWLINATQPYTVGIPWLASQKIGDHQITATEAAEAVGNAAFNKERAAEAYEAVKVAVAADYERLRGREVPESKEQWTDAIVNSLLDKWSSDLRYGSKDEFRKILAELNEQDALTLTYTDSLYDAMSTSKTMDNAQKALRLSMAGAKLTEVINRFTMARAAYELGSKHKMDAADKTDFINKAIYKTQGDFSRANRAQLFNHPVGATALQFKTYIQMMYALFAEGAVKAVAGKTAADRTEGRRLIGGLMASHAAIGGVTGLGPVGMMIKLTAVVAGFGAKGDDDEHYLFNEMDMDTQFRKGMRELLDDPNGESVLFQLAQGGLPTLLGVDISERAQLPKLVDTRFIRPTDDGSILNEANSLTMQMVGGAPYSTAVRIFDGVSKIADGTVDGNMRDIRLGIEKLSPSTLRGLLQAYDRGDLGIIDSSGRPIVERGSITPFELMATGLGLRTVREAEARNQRNDYFDVKLGVEGRKKELLQDYHRSRNADKVRAMRNISEFNASVPEALRITPKSLAQSEKSSSKALDKKTDKAIREMLK